MNKKNIVIIDSSEEEGKDFLEGLQYSTKMKWHLIVETSNDRRTKGKEFKRYLKYFYVPFKVFLSRKKYENIIAWQQFYGIMFAVYCRLFHVKKVNKLIVMSFIYKEKKGMIGKLYSWFINYGVTSKYIDVFTSVASVQCENFSKMFGVSSSKFKFIPWGITDFAQNYENLKVQSEPYFFCAGRSNRDWDIVFKVFGNIGIPCRFIYSDANYIGKYNNIDVHCNVPDEEYYSLSINSYCVIISIENCDLAGGEITIINAMQFGKPVILIQDNPKSDYVFEGITGFVVPKDKDRILDVAYRLMNDVDLRNRMSDNARKYYEEYFSIYSVGKEIGKLV